MSKVATALVAGLLTSPVPGSAFEELAPLPPVSGAVSLGAQEKQEKRAPVDIDTEIDRLLEASTDVEVNMVLVKTASRFARVSEAVTKYVEITGRADVPKTARDIAERRVECATEELTSYLKSITDKELLSTASKVVHAAHLSCEQHSIELASRRKAAAEKPLSDAERKKLDADARELTMSQGAVEKARAALERR